MVLWLELAFLLASWWLSCTQLFYSMTKMIEKMHERRREIPFVRWYQAGNPNGSIRKMLLLVTVMIVGHQPGWHGTLGCHNPRSGWHGVLGEISEKKEPYKVTIVEKFHKIHYFYILMRGLIAKEITKRGIFFKSKSEKHNPNDKKWICRKISDI